MIPWRLYAGVGLLVLAGLVWWRLSYLGGQVDQLRMEKALLTSANIANLETIQTLKAANDELANGRAADRKANRDAVEALTDRANRLQSGLVQARQQLKEAAHDPECAALLEHPVCPRLADGVRAGRGSD